MSKKNWKLYAVREMAEVLGLKIKFVPRTFGPRHVQNRICINGHRCQIAAAPCPNAEAGESAGLQAPKTDWAGFLIVVHGGHADGCGEGPVGAAVDNVKRFYIIPKAAFVQASRSFVNPVQLAEYEDAWHLLEWDRPRMSDGSNGSVSVCRTEERVVGQPAV